MAHFVAHSRTRGWSPGLRMYAYERVVCFATCMFYLQTCSLSTSSWEESKSTRIGTAPASMVAARYLLETARFASAYTACRSTRDSECRQKPHPQYAALHELRDNSDIASTLRSTHTCRCISASTPRVNGRSAFSARCKTFGSSNCALSAPASSAIDLHATATPLLDVPGEGAAMYMNKNVVQSTCMRACTHVPGTILCKLAHPCACIKMDRYIGAQG